MGNDDSRLQQAIFVSWWCFSSFEVPVSRCILHFVFCHMSYVTEYVVRLNVRGFIPRNSKYAKSCFNVLKCVHNNNNNLCVDQNSLSRQNFESRIIARPTHLHLGWRYMECNFVGGFLQKCIVGKSGSSCWTVVIIVDSCLKSAFDNGSTGRCTTDSTWSVFSWNRKPHLTTQPSGHNVAKQQYTTEKTA